MELDSDQLRHAGHRLHRRGQSPAGGRETEFWVDTRKMHIFDPKTGENLTRDAEAGARSAQEVADERHEDMDARHEKGRSAPGRPRMGPVSVRRLRFGGDAVVLLTVVR